MDGLAKFTLLNGCPLFTTHSGLLLPAYSLLLLNQMFTFLMLCIPTQKFTKQGKRISISICQSFGNGYCSHYFMDLSFSGCAKVLKGQLIQVVRQQIIGTYHQLRLHV